MYMSEKFGAWQVGSDRERLADFAAGVPPYKFGQVEQANLRADVHRLADIASAGGYKYFFQSFAMSAFG